MERLTKRNNKGITELNIRCPEGCEYVTCSPEEGYQCQHQCEGDIITKLAVYEDAAEQVENVYMHMMIFMKNMVAAKNV